jgi:hypothetical protein
MRYRIDGSSSGVSISVLTEILLLIAVQAKFGDDRFDDKRFAPRDCLS